MSTHKNDLLRIAINAAVDGGKAILDIYHQDFDVELKGDNSPLTLADTQSNQVIGEYLVRTGIPVISEENKEQSYSIRKMWNTCWLVDPLDGTKEFVKRNGEFTVNIALIENNQPILGVIFVPWTRELYYGDVKIGKSAKIILNEMFDGPDNLFEVSTLIHPFQNPWTFYVLWVAAPI